MKIMRWMMLIGGPLVLWFVFQITGVWRELSATLLPDRSLDSLPLLGTVQGIAAQPTNDARIVPDFARLGTPPPAATVAAETARRAAADLVAKGKNSLRTEQFADAVTQFSDALSQDPQWVAARLGLGWAHLARGEASHDAVVRAREFQSAMSDFSMARQLDSQSAESCRGSYEVDMRQGNYVAALADARQWSRLAPLSAPACAAKGKASLALQDATQAVAAYTQAIELTKLRSQGQPATNDQISAAQVSYLLDRADAYNLDGNAEAALSDLSQAKGQRPDDKDVVAAVDAKAGAIEFARRHTAAAIAWLDDWCIVEPNRNEPWYNLGTVLLSTSNTASADGFKEAIKAFDTARQRKPNDAPTLNNQAIAYWKLGQCYYADKDISAANTALNDARRDFGQAIQADPHYSLALETWATLEMGPDGNPVNAIDAYRRLLQDRPGDVRLFVALAKAFNRHLEFDNAIAEANKATNIEPNLSDAYLCIAQAEEGKWLIATYDNGNLNFPKPKPGPEARVFLEMAMKAANKAIELSPISLDAQQLRGRIKRELEPVKR